MGSRARHLRTADAARLLGVSPTTLRLIEQRRGGLTPSVAADGHRRFVSEEIDDLRNALGADPSSVLAGAGIGR